MKDKKWCFVVALVGYFAVLASCTDKETQAVWVEETLSFDAARVDTLIDRTIERIDFLPLEATESSDIYGVNKMVVKNDLIFMGDFHTGKVVVYDMQGKVKFVLDRKGAGPEEYLELKSFAVDEYNIYTLDNARHAMNVYDCRTGMFKESKKLPFVVWDMEVLDSDHFIFTFIPIEGGRPNLKQPLYKIFVTDKDLAITHQYLKYEQDDYECIGRPTYFTSMKDGVVFSSMDSDTFTVFFPGDSVKNVAIDFANKIPGRYRKQRKEILEGGYNYISQVPVLCKGYMAFEFSVGDNLITYLYDEKAGCFHANADVGSYNYLFQPLATYRDRLVCYLDNYSLYEEIAETGFERVPSAVEQHLKNEGAVLIFYTMR